MDTTPVEEAYQNFDSSLQRDTVEASRVNRLINKCTSNDEKYPYKASKEIRSLLNPLGIPCSKFAIEEHPHPGHKHLEIHLLNSIKYKLNTDTTIYFMKQEKFNTLTNRLPGNHSFTLHNQIITGADLARYPETESLVFTHGNTPTYFIHDALHYLMPCDIAEMFHDNPNLDTIYATLVCPIEVAKRHSSYYPDLYDLRYNNDSFTYIPENHTGGAYTQPYTSLFFLTHRTITFNGLVLTISKLESFFGHHIISITRAPVVAPNLYYFSAPPVFKLPKIYRIQENLRYPYIPWTLHKRTMDYIKSVTELKPENCYNKVRTLLAQEDVAQLPPATLDLYVDLCMILIPARNLKNATSKLITGFTSFLSRYTLGLVRDYTFGALIMYFRKKIHKILDCPPYKPCQKLYDHVLTPLASSSALFDPSQRNHERRQHLNNKIAAMLFGEATLTGLTAHLEPVSFRRRILNKALRRRTAVQLNPTNYAAATLRQARLTCRPTDSISTVGSSAAPSSTTGSDSGSYQIPEYYYSSPQSNGPAPSLSMSFSPPTIVSTHANFMQCPAYTTLLSNLMNITPALDICTGAVTCFQCTATIIVDASGPSNSPGPVRSATCPNGHTLANGDHTLLDNTIVTQPPANWHRNIRNHLVCINPDDQIYRVQNAVYSHTQNTSRPNQSRTNSNRQPGSAGSVRASQRGVQTPTSQTRRPTSHTPSNNSQTPRSAANSYTGLQRGPWTENYCLLTCFSTLSCRSISSIWRDYTQIYGAALADSEVNNRLGAIHIYRLAKMLRMKVELRYVEASGTCSSRIYGQRNRGQTRIIYYTESHFQLDRFDPTPDITEPKTTNPDHEICPVTELTDDERTIASNYPGHFYYYRPTRARAKQYTTEIKDGTTGILSRVRDAQGNNYAAHLASMDNRVEHYQDANQMRIFVITGFAGSGKSSHLYPLCRQRLRRSRGDITIISPRIHLRRQWKEKINPMLSISIKTFEKALVQNGTTIGIIDEFPLLPPGYIDTLLINQAGYQSLILLGDPLQARFHEPNPESCLRDLPSESEQFLPFADFYYLHTYRLSRRLADLFGITTFSNTIGALRTISQIDASKKILTPKQAHAADLTEFDYVAYTYCSVQGLDWDTDYQIEINDLTARNSFNNIYCALTRGKREVHLFDNRFRTLRTNTIYNQIIAPGGLQLEFFATLYQTLPPHCRIIEPLIGGKHTSLEKRVQHLYSDKFQALTALAHLETTYYEEKYNPLPETISSEESIPAYTEKPELKTAAQREDESFINEVLLGPLAAPEVKEMYSSRQEKHSEQFLHAYDQKAVFSSIFPRHLNSDSVTFEAALKKRIRFSSSQKKAKQLRDKSHLGLLLFQAFTKKLKLKSRPFDRLLFEACTLENEEKRLEKPLGQLVNNIARADPDWDPHYTDIFMKTQYCTKLEKMHSHAKAGQTLATFCDQVYFTTGPVARYIQHQVNRQLPTNIYIHGGKTNEQLNDFVRKNWDDTKTSSARDYEAYDQSQTAEFVQFQLLLLKFFNIPHHLIDYIRDLKSNLFSWCGPLAFMIFTGFTDTFQSNTFDNIAYTALIYEIPPDTIELYSGDDSDINDQIRVNVSPGFLKQFTLVAKLELKQITIFCGWIITSVGILKDPVLLLCRLKHAAEKKNITLFLNNYAREHFFLYTNYELTFHLLTEEQQAAHYVLTRFFTRAFDLTYLQAAKIRAKSLLKFKTNKRSLFSFKEQLQSWKTAAAGLF